MTLASGEEIDADVVINLPGIKDAQGALKVLGETATLYFRPVICSGRIFGRVLRPRFNGGEDAWALSMCRFNQKRGDRAS